MDETKTIETIDLTEESQVEQDPVIESLPNPEVNNETQPEVNQEAPEAPGVEEETLPDVQEQEAPETEDKFSAVIGDLTAKIDNLLARVDQLAATVNNINKIEEARADGPQGFFKPIGGTEPQKTPEDILPRIEKIYV